MDGQLPICSYGTACFRKNPFHLRQQSHPHLEKLLAEFPDDSAIILPEKLEFECLCRGLLQEQLEVFRRVKRRDIELAKQTHEGSEARGTKQEESERKQENVRNTRQIDDPDRRLANRIKLREEILQKMRSCGVKLDYVPELDNFALKWALAAPYHIFYTAVQKSPETWKQPLSVTFFEILDRSLGEIDLSLHINFVVDFGWLVAQYLLAGQQAKMVVFYGDSSEDVGLPTTIQKHKIKCPNSFGCHHGKVSILKYKDGGIRIVVSTANLYRDDWDFRTQGLWMSPHLPRLGESAGASDGESPTGFKNDFINFLSAYGQPMKQFKAIVQRADCSSINVAFCASVPGNYNGDDIVKWGHKKLGTILKKHTSIPVNEPSTTIIAQASSIGSLGPNYQSWITTDIVASMSNTKEPTKTTPDFKLIYPTIENFKISHDMRELKNCLTYTMERHNKQKWFTRYMHQWKADHTGRSRSVPHIKSFTRISEDEKRIWWFVLGSSNFSKAAWGYSRGRTFSILNYEANVIFLPKFVTAENDFAIKEDPSRTTPIFPLYYDLPLTPYSASDRPFVADFFNDNFPK